MGESAQPIQQPQTLVAQLGFSAKLALTVGLALVAVLGLMFLWYSLSVLLLVFSAGVMAVFLRAVSIRLHKIIRINEGIALAVVVTSMVLLLVLLIALATPTLANQAQEVANNIPLAFNALKQQLTQFGWGQELLISLDIPKEQVLSFLTGQSELFNRIGGVFSTTLDVVAAVFVVIMMSIYLAAEPNLYVNGLIRLFPCHRRQRMREVLACAYITLKSWFLGQILSMTILGILMTLGLWLLEVPLAMTLGAFTAVMTFIPNFGPLIAGVPTLLLALSVSPMTCFYALIWILIVQNLEGMLVTPIIHRNIIALPPALVISVQVLLASIYGFIGLLVAMPLVVLGMVMVRKLYVEDILEANGDAKGMAPSQ